MIYELTVTKAMQVKVYCSANSREEAEKIVLGRSGVLEILYCQEEKPRETMAIREGKA